MTAPTASASEMPALIHIRGMRQSRGPSLDDLTVVDRPIAALITAPLKRYLRIPFLSVSTRSVRFPRRDREVEDALRDRGCRAPRAGWHRRGDGTAAHS